MHTADLDGDPRGNLPDRTSAAGVHGEGALVHTNGAPLGTCPPWRHRPPGHEAQEGQLPLPLPSRAVLVPQRRVSGDMTAFTARAVLVPQRRVSGDVAAFTARAVLVPQRRVSDDS